MVMIVFIAFIDVGIVLLFQILSTATALFC